MSADCFLISIHAPAKGATPPIISLFPSVQQFQSTLPRRERLFRALKIRFFQNISIHAPAKGATPRSLCTTCARSFQSTLPRRERPYPARCAAGAPCHFNPRSREGSDADSQQRQHDSGSDFNPRSREGSDKIRRFRHFPKGIFQSTLPRRERPELLDMAAKRRAFQSTLPRRERPRRARVRYGRGNFNPRSREGSDLTVILLGGAKLLFQSTLPRRERRKVFAYSIHSMKISIHAPAKGATPVRPDRIVIRYRFQSTRPRRERLFDL